MNATFFKGNSDVTYINAASSSSFTLDNVNTFASTSLVTLVAGTNTVYTLSFGRWEQLDPEHLRDEVIRDGGGSSQGKGKWDM
jgi:hypothetical protein